MSPSSLLPQGGLLLAQADAGLPGAGVPGLGEAIAF
jgi:hypothetical protein